MVNNYSTLHNDLLLQIFCYLTPFEIPTLQLINKHWNFYCKDNILWKFYYHYYFIKFGLNSLQNNLQEKCSVFSDCNFDYNNFLLSTTNYCDNLYNNNNKNNTDNNLYNNNCKENEEINNENYWYNKFIYFTKFLPHYQPNESHETFTKLLQKNNGLVNDNQNNTDDENYNSQFKYKNVYQFKIFNKNFNQYDEFNSLNNSIKLMKLSLLLSILMYEGNYSLNILQDSLIVCCKYFIDNFNSFKNKNNINYNDDSYNDVNYSDEDKEDYNNNEGQLEGNDFTKKPREDVLVERNVMEQIPILSFCKLLLDYNYKDIFNLICSETIQKDKEKYKYGKIKLSNRYPRRRLQQQQEEEDDEEEEEEEKDENYYKTIGILPNVEFNDVFCYIDRVLDDRSYDANVDDSCYRVSFSDSESDYSNSDWCAVYFNASAYWRHTIRFDVEFNVKKMEIIVKASSCSGFY
ncbi:hypothetical protein ABK040_010211 [Willaertia magna]